MTARDKELIFKTWIRFLNNNFKRTNFTKRLYEHLHLHCGYIAHYNIDGFYSTYFNGDFEDLKRFFSNWESDGGYSYPNPDYSDLNKAMIEEYKKQKEVIFQTAQKSNDTKFEILKEMMRRAEADIEFRNSLLNKIF